MVAGEFSGISPFSPARFGRMASAAAGARIRLSGASRSNLLPVKRYLLTTSTPSGVRCAQRLPILAWDGMPMSQPEIMVRDWIRPATPIQ
jgi:hypothetical protein